MAALTVVTLTRAGVLTSGGAAASAGGDTFPNDGNTFITVVNGGGSACTVTLPITQLVDGQTPTAKTVVVANGTTVQIGPFPQAIYNDATGSVALSYSQVSSVTVKAISVPRTN